MLNLANICAEVNESNKKLPKLHKRFLKVQKTFKDFTLSEIKHFLKKFVVPILKKRALNQRMSIKDRMYDLCSSGVGGKN